jgi:fermentation-respiration switch protein FrsA (DUF1100 family)
MVRFRTTLSAVALLLGALGLSVIEGCAAQPAPSLPPSAVSQKLATATRAVPTNAPSVTISSTQVPDPTLAPTAGPTATSTAVPLNPLQIEYLREREFLGSDITIEQTLTPGSNYNRYIAWYESDGLKIYALLTVPKGNKPKSGWPVIIFNHGYIPPAQYKTTERYVAYVDAIARSGYIVFKSDYRGHGESEGDASGGYGSPAYTIDVLNAVASMKNYPDADPNRIGMWGHSMGGQVTLRSMVVSQDIKAGVIWAGVVGTYSDLLNNWHQRSAENFPAPPYPGGARRWRQDLIDEYGAPAVNPQFWDSISPNTYVADLSGPLQLHHDIADSEVPSRFSQELYDEVKQAGKTTELYTYPGDDHNIAQNFGLAMQRTIAFFNKYVKASPPS